MDFNEQEKKIVDIGITSPQGAPTAEEAFLMMTHDLQKRGDIKRDRFN